MKSVTEEQNFQDYILQADKFVSFSTNIFILKGGVKIEKSCENRTAKVREKVIRKF